MALWVTIPAHLVFAYFHDRNVLAQRRREREEWPCPFCKRSILRTAQICEHCGLPVSSDDGENAATLARIRANPSTRKESNVN